MPNNVGPHNSDVPDLSSKHWKTWGRVILGIYQLLLGSILTGAIAYFLADFLLFVINEYGFVQVIGDIFKPSPPRDSNTIGAVGRAMENAVMLLITIGLPWSIITFVSGIELLKKRKFGLWSKISLFPQILLLCIIAIGKVFA